MILNRAEFLKLAATFPILASFGFADSPAIRRIEIPDAIPINKDDLTNFVTFSGKVEGPVELLDFTVAGEQYCGESRLVRWPSNSTIMSWHSDQRWPLLWIPKDRLVIPHGERIYVRIPPGAQSCITFRKPRS